MAKSPKDKPADPTQDLAFQRVVQHFLKTPHKPHEPLRKKRDRKKSSGGTAAKDQCPS